ncbi:MAG: MarR family transcriptional regulator [Betaproteobacteria bacterium]|nr:MarR family transcriptional regulator [Betaproteobacteria bacterium]
MQHTKKGQLFTEAILEIFKVSGQLAVEGDRLTKELGLSSARWKVLGALKMSNEPLTVAQVARVMGLTRQSVQRLADAMVKDGLMVYQINPHHKRANYVVLTEKGKAAYSIITEIQIPWANENSKDISEVDLNTTLSVLRKISLLFK